MTPEFALETMPEDAASNPVFAQFISDYYKWNQDEGFSGILNSYRSLLYQNAYSDEYEQRIIKNNGIDFSIIENSQFHVEILYKLMNEFLETRGTSTSFKLLFRMMFNKDVDIQYPRDRLLVPSVSSYQRTSLILMSGDVSLDVFSSLRGLRSNTYTNIESLIPYFIENKRYYLVECNNIYDEFIIGEPIKVTTVDGYQYTEIHNPLIHLKINDAGLYYKKGDIINPSSNLFFGNFYVKSVNKGSIDGAVVLSPGIGYSVGDKINLGSRSPHFSAEVSMVDDTDGSVLKVTIKNGGYNFEEIPEHFIYSETGTGLELSLTSGIIGSVKEIGISDGGVIYDTVNMTYDVNSSRGIGLNISSKAVPCYYISRYTDKKGFMSYNSTILDSKTKHSHSYDIISDVPANKYVAPLEKYVNPSGYYYNTIYQKTNNINIAVIEVFSELIRE